MEYREGYTTERYNGNNIHQYNDEYSNNIYLVFFGISLVANIPKPSILLLPIVNESSNGL